jgi:hypothetical protein
MFMFSSCARLITMHFARYISWLYYKKKKDAATLRSTTRWRPFQSNVYKYDLNIDPHAFSINLYSKQDRNMNVTISLYLNYRRKKKWMTYHYMHVIHLLWCYSIINENYFITLYYFFSLSADNNGEFLSEQSQPAYLDSVFFLY